MDIPEGLPEHLKEEYLKMMRDEKKYSKMYQVAYRILKSYINKEDTNGKKED